MSALARLVCLQVLELLLDRKAGEARHAREVALRDAEIGRLQVYIDDELAELQQRQAQVCVGASPGWPCPRALGSSVLTH